MIKGEAMQQIYSDIIQFRGSHYDFGFMQGKLLKDSFTIENRKKQWKLRRPRFTIEVEEVKQAMLDFAPGIWDELLGLRDALEWSMDDTLQEFGGYRTNYKRSGCSIYSGSDYMIRNYDYHPKTYEGRFSLYQPSDEGHAVMGPTQQITGRLDGMNEKGLVLGYNFTNRKKPGEGFISNMISRIVLETCANVQEAIQLLQGIPHRYAFSYAVLDEREETFIVEGSARGTHVRKGNICTNHFEELEQENRNYLDDSYKRMHAIQAQRSAATDAQKAFQMLNDTDKGIFSKQYKNWGGTIHTSAYFPKDLKAWFALGGDSKPNEIDFSKWILGKNIEYPRIYGEVDTELPFAHMEKNVR